MENEASKYYLNLSLENIIYVDDEGNQCVERWKDINGFEGLYQVSDMGRIKSLSRKVISAIKPPYITRKAKIRKQNICKGYLQVGLKTDFVNKIFYCHRLVGIAFVENPFSLKEINHKKGNKLDNRYFSIEWSTRSYNCSHAFRELGRSRISGMKGKSGELYPCKKKLGKENHRYGKKGFDCPLSKNIICNETNIVYGGISEAARELKLSSGNIVSVLKGNRNHTHGLTFSYVQNG